MEPRKANKTPKEHGRSEYGVSSESVDCNTETLNHSTTALISERLTRGSNWDLGMKCSRRKLGYVLHMAFAVYEANKITYKCYFQ